jgi:hypothetical protein
VEKFLVIFSTGDDVQPSPERQAIDQLGVEVVVVGPSSYDSEIQGESRYNVLVDEWSGPTILIL